MTQVFAAARRNLVIVSQYSSRRNLKRRPITLVVLLIILFTILAIWLPQRKSQGTGYLSQQVQVKPHDIVEKRNKRIIDKPYKKIIPFQQTKKVTEGDGVEYFYQVPYLISSPSSWSSLSQPRVSVGIVLLFHGCTHDGIDWFELPEERRIVRFLLYKGFVVISISSFDRINSKCWDTHYDGNYGDSSSNQHETTSKDVARIVGTLPILLKELEEQHNIASGEMRLYGIGASSGGDFISILQHYIPFHGLNVMISPGRKNAWAALKAKTEDAGRKKSTKASPPRIAFVYMPKDTRYAGAKQIDQNIEEYLSNIPVQKYPCGPIPVTANLLVDRIDGLSMDNANIIIQGLVELNMLTTSTYTTRTGDDATVLGKDPRRAWDNIEQMLIRDVHAETLLIESMREVLNVAYANHELTSEHIDQVVKFWMDG
jgi:hypothetical protein